MVMTIPRKKPIDNTERTMYIIIAWWPVANAAPYITYSPNLDDMINLVIEMAKSNKYMSISGRTPDELEIIRMFGQLKGMP
jgi:hypothetical protein